MKLKDGGAIILGLIFGYLFLYPEFARSAYKYEEWHTHCYERDHSAACAAHVGSTSRYGSVATSARAARHASTGAAGCYVDFDNGNTDLWYSPEYGPTVQCPNGSTGCEGKTGTTTTTPLDLYSMVTGTGPSADGMYVACGDSLVTAQPSQAVQDWVNGLVQSCNGDGGCIEEGMRESDYCDIDVAAQEYVCTWDYEVEDDPGAPEWDPDENGGMDIPEADPDAEPEAPDTGYEDVTNDEADFGCQGQDNCYSEGTNDYWNGDTVTEVPDSGCVGDGQGGVVCGPDTFEYDLPTDSSGNPIDPTDQYVNEDGGTVNYYDNITIIDSPNGQDSSQNTIDDSSSEGYEGPTAAQIGSAVASALKDDLNDIENSIDQVNNSVSDLNDSIQNGSGSGTGSTGDGTGDGGGTGDGTGEGEGEEGEEEETFSGPGLEDGEGMGDAMQRLYNGISNSPIANAVAGLEANFPTGGTCPPMDLTFTFMNRQMGDNVTLHCELMESFAPVLSAAMIFMWSFVAFRIFMSA